MDYKTLAETHWDRAKQAAADYVAEKESLGWDKSSLEIARHAYEIGVLHSQIEDLLRLIQIGFDNDSYCAALVDVLEARERHHD